MLNIIVGCLSPAFRKIIRLEKPCMNVFPGFSQVQDPQGIIIEQRIVHLQKARDKALATHELARQLVAERVHQNFTPFKAGEKVWLEAKNLKTTHLMKKLAPKREGPFLVKKVLNPLKYRLSLPKQWRIHPVFHAALLTPYKETEAHGPNFLEPPPDLIKGEKEYEVKAIIGHKKRGRGFLYLMKWVGYPTSENSWKPEGNLTHARETLSKYQKSDASDPSPTKMQNVNLTPSSISSYRFLNDSTNQLAIRTSITQDPKLANIYEAWTHNQHILSYAKKQEATLFASLQGVGIQKHTNRLSRVIQRPPLHGRSPTIRRLPSPKCTPPPSSTTTPKRQTHPLHTEIDLTKETGSTSPSVYPCYMADATCFTCK